MDSIFFSLALILFLSKALGLVMRKLKLPEVIGALLAGLILGPNILGWVRDSDLLSGISQIGVVFIMFSAGLETDLKQIRSAGKPSVVITLLGVIVPMALGFGAACLFRGVGDREKMIQNLYYGVILTATSVALTVATLKELGKLNGKVGTSVLSAAVLDDVIGLIILTVVIGQSVPGARVADTVLNTLFFFVIAIAVGIIINQVFKIMEHKYEHHRRLPILGLCTCLLFAFMAENLFGLAEIVGAFIAGLIFSDTRDAKYIERRVDQSSYMLFSPIFFAHISIACRFQNFDSKLIAFGLIWVILGFAGKFIGCSAGAKMCGFSGEDSVKVGIGMMARAEVALITTQKGVSAGLISSDFMPFVIILVIVGSIMTPILLKLAYRKELNSSPLSETTSSK